MSSHLEDHIFGGDEHHDPPLEHAHDRAHSDDAPVPRTRSEARSRQHGRPPRQHDEGSRASRFIVPLVALALLVGLGVGAYVILKPIVTGALSSSVEDYPGPGSGEVTVTVTAGESGTDIARSLVDAGVIASTAAFVEASNADPAAAAAIQPGDYTLLKEMKASDALAALNDPDNRYLGEPVTIREGLWKAEVFAALSEATGIPVEDYEAAAEDAEAIGLPDQADGNVEGWLFPATYTLRPDASAADHLAVLVDEAKAQLADAGVPEDEWQRTLTVASIVEGEARADVDLGKVARVVENRLADPAGPTVGRLEMDSTVNYALQKRGNLTRTEFEEAKSHPYDTYVIQGLPPGPIGSPGRAAIDAAANPTEGPWFFFVTVNLDTGETLFAETFAEHQANDRLRVQWCEDNPGKCTGGG